MADGQKKEAALFQHYLSPNQIKPNYLSSIRQSRFDLG
jgi:hypothetical protein